MIRGQPNDRKRASKPDMESNWRALRDARAARPDRPLTPAEEGCECADERPRGASEEGNFFCEVTKEFVHSRSIVAAQGSDDFILGRIHKWKPGAKSPCRERRTDKKRASRFARTNYYVCQQNPRNSRWPPVLRSQRNAAKNRSRRSKALPDKWPSR